MNRALFVVVLLGAGCSAPGGGRLLLRGGDLDIDGDVGVSAGGGALTSGSDAKALGIDESDIHFQPRVDLDWGEWHAILQGTQADYDGVGAAETTITRGGPPITVGTALDTEVDLDLYTVSVLYDLYSAGPVELGVGIGGGYLDYSVSFAALSGALLVESESDYPLLYLTGRVAADMKLFEASLVANGVSFSYDDDDLSYYELDFAMSFHRMVFLESLPGTLAVGYRLVHVDYEYDDGLGKATLDADFSGPYVGLSFAF